MLLSLWTSAIGVSYLFFKHSAWHFLNFQDHVWISLLNAAMSYVQVFKKNSFIIIYYFYCIIHKLRSHCAQDCRNLPQKR